jgi:hypothetical protein
MGVMESCMKQRTPVALTVPVIAFLLFCPSPALAQGLAEIVEPAPSPGAQPAGGAQTVSSKVQKTARTTPGSWTDLGFLHVNATYQTGPAFTDSFTYVQYAENASVSTRYPKAAGASFDVGGGIRLWRNLAVGGVLARFTGNGTAMVNATIPQPLYLNQDRTVAGPFSPSRRSETALHMQATWVVPSGKRLLIKVSGGPSVFNLKQALVSGVRWSGPYPYDTLDFTADAQDISKTTLGFNAGGDVAYFFTKTIGVGGMVRYAYARARLGSKSGALTVGAGGLQAGGGLRIRLLARPPKRKGPKPPAPKPPAPTKRKEP